MFINMKLVLILAIIYAGCVSGAPVSTCSVMSSGTLLSCYRAIDTEGLRDLDVTAVTNIKFKGGELDWGFLSSNIPLLREVSCLDPVVKCIGVPIAASSSCVCHSDTTVLSTLTTELSKFEISTPTPSRGTNLELETVTHDMVPEVGSCMGNSAETLLDVLEQLDSFQCFNEFVGGAGASTGIIIMALLCLLMIVGGSIHILRVFGRRLHAVCIAFLHYAFFLHYNIPAVTFRFYSRLYYVVHNAAFDR
jgi:hypothetical protein